mmetsp:Transcript_25147/g.30966  ORF Transcript_25147/g.30966 Transcript_25147/m.30966 type:complete len:93 (+) Transcript_25147:267-545(+)
MSFYRKTRVKNQGTTPHDSRYHFALMEREAIERIVSDDLVDTIQNLNLCGLYYHPDRKEDLTIIIKMQFVRRASNATAFSMYTQCIHDLLFC